MDSVPVETIVTLSASQIADLRLASQSLTGAARRAFQAEMTLKYCDGKARLAEKVFGWGRHTVALGLAEKRTGLICVGCQSGFGGTKRWEDRYPAAAEALRVLAETHCQQEPSFKSSIAYTRLTAAEARLQLQAQGFSAHIPHFQLAQRELTRGLNRGDSISDRALQRIAGYGDAHR